MFNVLCNRNPWAKALVQTLVLTIGAGVWLAWSTFAYAVKMSY